MINLTLALILLAPQSSLREEVATARQALENVQRLLDEEQAPTPELTPVSPGRELPGTLRLFGDVPSQPFPIRFAGPVTLSGIRSAPIAWGPSGQPSAYLHEALVDPQTLEDGELHLSELLQLPPDPARWPVLPLAVRPGGEPSAKSILLSGQTLDLGGLRIFGQCRQWRPGVFEFEVSMTALEDGYWEGVGIDFAGRVQIFCPDNRIPGSQVLIDDGGLPFVWLEGQTTVRRFLLGRHLTDEDRDRFASFEYMAALRGPGSYHHGGWGATRSGLPDLSVSALGYDFIETRHEDALEDALQLEQHVLEGASHGEFKYQNGLGPWHPRGSRSGGAAGGSEIHPYTAWGLTPGEARRAWWQMRTMLERMPENYYDHDEGFPGSVEQWYRPYEDELILYQPHDTPHSQRAMLSPTACAWNSGSPAAAYWLRGFPLRYAVPGPYGDEFDGEGHKYANRGDGWRATRLANAYALTEPDSPMRAVLLDLAQQQADRMLNVAMPSGITSRSGDIAAGGPFAANLNPNPWDLGHLPEGSTVARSIMTAIVANGAMALERSVFGDGRMIPLIVDSADSSYFHVVPGTSALKTPPSGHVIVGGLQIGQVLPETSYSVLDPSKIALETQWHLVYAFELTGSEHYLERAVEITGLNVSSMSQFPEREYQLTGSARVWWAYTPELVSLIQRTYE